MNPSASLIGENIRVIRQARGLTQGRVAEAIGIRAGPLGNIERGVNLPSARVVEGLCRVLGVSADAFFAADPASRNRCLRRALPSPFRADLDGSGIPGKLKERFQELVDAILELETRCGVSKRASIPLYLPFPQTEEGVAGLAGRVRALMEVGDGVIFDYVELFESYGFRVAVLARLPREMESASYYDPANGNAFFFLNGALNAERLLFRLAYELGHLYLVTADLLGWPAAKGEGVLDARHAAMKFAAFFLMPEAAVRALVAQVGVKPDEWTESMLFRLKHRFGVSAESFLYRLNELALIEPLRSARLKRTIHGYYARTGFKEPDDSRRVMTVNGRIRDLLEIAQFRAVPPAQVEKLAALFRKHCLAARFRGPVLGEPEE